eukprot:gene2259-2474_t
MKRIASLYAFILTSLFCTSGCFRWQAMHHRARSALLSSPQDSLFSSDEVHYPEQISTVDLFGDPTDVTDAEVLQRMREARIRYNDGWQSSLFHENNAGSWSGSYDLFLPLLSDPHSELKLRNIQSGLLSSLVSITERNSLGSFFHIQEVFQPSISQTEDTVHQALLGPTRAVIRPEDFRPANGMQCVANGYTSAEWQDNVFVAELGLREGQYRTRVRFVYDQQALFKEFLSGLKGDATYTLGLAGIAIMRERLLLNDNSSPAIPSPQMEVGVGVAEDAGQEIYDPQANGSPYSSIQLPHSGLSLFFPAALKAINKSVLTMQVSGRRGLCYQLDRIFAEPGRPLLSLELTEVRLEDTEKYPAPFLPRPEILM